MAQPPNPQQLQEWFQAVDTDSSGQLSAEELQRALVNGDWSPFNIETVRLMVNLFDTDQSGTIGLPEFQGLWQYIDQWKQCFQGFDVDRSGTIDKNELSQALKTFGYNLTERFVELLIKKFDHKSTGDITFDNFIQVCVTIKMLTESFRRFDTDGDGWIQIRYEDAVLTPMSEANNISPNRSIYVAMYAVVVGSLYQMIPHLGLKQTIGGTLSVIFTHLPLVLYFLGFNPAAIGPQLAQLLKSGWDPYT